MLDVVRVSPRFVVGGTLLVATIAACTSFGGTDAVGSHASDSDSGSTTTTQDDAGGHHDEVDAGFPILDTDAAGETDSGVADGGSGPLKVLPCSQYSQASLLFCNDFDNAPPETAFTNHGSTPPGIDNTKFVSAPAALTFNTMTVDYVTWTSPVSTPTFTLTFAVYLPSTTAVNTEFAYIQPTSSQLPFKKTASGITVGSATEIAVPFDTWLQVTVKGVSDKQINVEVTPGGARAIAFPNTQALIFGIGIITNGPGASFDNVLALH